LDNQETSRRTVQRWKRFYQKPSGRAEAFLRAYAGEHFEVHSAGLEPKGLILPEVVEAMQEVGLSLEGQFSKGVDTYLGRAHFAHVITVCGDAEENCPVVFLNMGTHEHWPFDDPAKFAGTRAERLERTRQVRDQIAARVRRWLEDQHITPAAGAIRQAD
jgi:arsenate reductase